MPLSYGLVIIKGFDEIGIIVQKDKFSTDQTISFRMKRITENTTIVKK